MVFPLVLNDFNILEGGVASYPFFCMADTLDTPLLYGCETWT